MADMMVKGRHRDIRRRAYVRVWRPKVKKQQKMEAICHSSDGSIWRSLNPRSRPARPSGTTMSPPGSSTPAPQWAMPTSDRSSQAYDLSSLLLAGCRAGLPDGIFLGKIFKKICFLGFGLVMVFLALFSTFSRLNYLPDRALTVLFPHDDILCNQANSFECAT